MKQCAVLMILIISIIHGDESTFPMWPDRFIPFNAETFGMGDVNLFTEGPFAVAQNPANLEAGFCFAGQSLYEIRESVPGYPWSAEDVFCLPQSFSLTFPELSGFTIGLHFDQIILWHGSSDVIKENSSRCNRITIGIRSPDLGNLNLGFGLISLWAKEKMLFNGESTSYLMDVHGIGFVNAMTFKIGKHSKLGASFTPYISLKGATFLEAPGTIDTGQISDNLPMDLRLGYAQTLHRRVNILLQLTCRYWRRGRLAHNWGKPEWVLNCGVEFPINKLFCFRLGGITQQFYSDWEIPFFNFSKKGKARVVFLTSGAKIGSETFHIDFGIGRTVAIEHNTIMTFYSERTVFIASATVSIGTILEKIRKEGS